jgi:hypothetical protein
MGKDRYSARGLAMGARPMGETYPWGPRRDGEAAHDYRVTRACSTVCSLQRLGSADEGDEREGSRPTMFWGWGLTVGMGRWRKVDFDRCGGGSSMAACSYRRWRGRSAPAAPRSQRGVSHAIKMDGEPRKGGAHQKAAMAAVAALIPLLLAADFYSGVDQQQWGVV